MKIRIAILTLIAGTFSMAYAVNYIKNPDGTVSAHETFTTDELEAKRQALIYQMGQLKGRMENLNLQIEETQSAMDRVTQELIDLENAK